MRTILRGTTLLVSLSLCGAVGAPLAAQRVPRGLTEVRSGERGGFWLGFGLGAGGESFDLRDGLGYSDNLYRPTVSLRLGGTVSPALRLGGEIMSWIDDHGRSTETLSSALFIGQLYPAGSAGLYLKGGLGLGRNQVKFDDADFDTGDTGFAGLVGLGYELPIGRRVFLTPAVDLVQHWYHPNRGGAGYRERLLNFGLGIGFQAGR
jgi:hypothetical protein